MNRKKHVACTARKEAVLTFSREQLIYDIGNYAYVQAELMERDEGLRRKFVGDIVQTGNVDRVTRVLDMAYTECVEMLYPYSKEETGDDKPTLDDSLPERDAYEIKLSLPVMFSLTTLHMLEHLLHEYLVCRVLADWMSITNPESEATWERKYTTLREKIRTSLVSRSGKMRRRLKPF